MVSTLLIENIKVGKLDFDDMSGIVNPHLKTYIEDIGYSVVMEKFNFDFMEETIEVIYLYTEYDEDGYNRQIVYEFSTKTMKYAPNGQPNDFYRLTKVKEE